MLGVKIKQATWPHDECRHFFGQTKQPLWRTPKAASGVAANSMQMHKVEELCSGVSIAQKRRVRREIDKRKRQKADDPRLEDPYT